MKKNKRKILAIGLAIGVVLGSIAYCPSDNYVNAYSKTSTHYWTKKTGKKVVKVKKVKCKIYHYVAYGKYCATGKITKQTVANNYYPIGQKMYIDGYGMKVVRDRGGKGLNTPYKIDVYIPRIKGESNKRYLKRVSKMGVKTKNVYLLWFKK